MKNSFLIVTATLLVSVFFSCTKERVTAGSVNEVYEFQSVDSTWKLLTLREKIEIGRASVGKECRSRWSPYH